MLQVQMPIQPQSNLEKLLSVHFVGIKEEVKKNYWIIISATNSKSLTILSITLFLMKIPKWHWHWKTIHSLMSLELHLNSRLLLEVWVYILW